MPFLVVQGGVGGNIGLALETLSKYVEGQLKEMQSRTSKLAEKLMQSLQLCQHELWMVSMKSDRVSCTAEDD